MVRANYGVVYEKPRRSKYGLKGHLNVTLILAKIMPVILCKVQVYKTNLLTVQENSVLV